MTASLPALLEELYLCCGIPDLFPKSGEGKLMLAGIADDDLSDLATA